LNKRIVLTAAALAGALVLGGGVALAATSGPESSAGVITGCYTNAAVNGSHALFVQNAGTSCPKGTSAISWNEQGPAGQNGSSATVTPLASGNTNCPGGGAEIQAGTSTPAYACNGANGTNGTQGTPGAPAAIVTWTVTCTLAETAAGNGHCTGTSTDSIPAGVVVTPVAFSGTGCGEPVNASILDGAGNYLVNSGSLSSVPDTAAAGGPLNYIIPDDGTCTSNETVTFTFAEGVTQAFS
jgi:hypothetical protein